jgi:hypothetical protein
MGLLFLRHERQNLLAMVGEVAERVENLGFGDAQGRGNVGNWLPAMVKSRDVTHGHSQAVDYRLAPAQAFEPNDMWVLGLNVLRHPPSLIRSYFASITIARSAAKWLNDGAIE